MKLILIIFSIFLTNSCNVSKQTSDLMTNQQHLSGSYIVSILTDNDTLSINPEITFDSNTHRVYGFSGCNRFNGTYTISGHDITFGSMASTRMFCEEEANNIERLMLDALSQHN